MPSLPFSLPSPFGGSSLSFVPSAVLGLTPAALPGSLDRVIDPKTLDYVRLPDGTWADTADSRTIVLIALSVRLNGSPWDPEDGTQLAAMRERGQSISPELALAETQRVGTALTRDGILSRFTASVRTAAGTNRVDALGRLSILCNWHDLASGSPVNLVYTVR